MKPIKVEIEIKPGSISGMPKLSFYGKDRKYYSIPGDPETLLSVAVAIKAHFGEAETEETKQRASTLEAAKQFAANCPECRGLCYHGIQDGCPECLCYIKYLMETEDE